MYIKECRICKSKDLYRFLDLGMHPPSDAFLKKEQLNLPEPKFPLDVFFCKNCGLVQLGFVVQPELMFNKDYVYITSVSKTHDKHFEQLAREAVERFNPDGGLVIDIGGNDGTLLKHFKKFGCKVLNVDPSGVAQLAIKSGIDTFNDFFTEETARKILKERGKAKIITGTNVFAHIHDLDDVLRGVNLLLEDNGVFIIESPYLVDLIENIEFDTIYHEHLSYLAIRPLSVLFSRFKMKIFDVKRTSIHGGSIRVFVEKENGKWPVTNAAKDLVELENRMKLDEIETYIEFAKKVEKLKKDLVMLLKELKAKGKMIIGNGAAAKGNTLLNYCQIGPEIIDYIVEINPIKQGLYTPGMHIPVVPLEKVEEDKPDYMLILPWNIKDDIMKQEERIRKWGGKFIIPVPKPVVV
jgi:hypothetical protein